MPGKTYMMPQTTYRGWERSYSRSRPDSFRTLVRWWSSTTWRRAREVASEFPCQMRIRTRCCSRDLSPPGRHSEGCFKLVSPRSSVRLGPPTLLGVGAQIASSEQPEKKLPSSVSVTDAGLLDPISVESKIGVGRLASRSSIKHACPRTAIHLYTHYSIRGSWRGFSGVRARWD